MFENINNVKKYKLLATVAENSSEYKFNKMDLIHKLNMNNNVEELEMRQIQSGFIFLEVSQQFKNIIKEWYELACNYHYINDNPSIIPNNSNFIEHRHDQSIFSLLIKKNKLYQKCFLESYHCINDNPSIIPNNSNFIEHRHDQSIFSLLIKKNKLYQKCFLESTIFCIKCARNKSGISYYIK